MPLTHKKLLSVLRYNPRTGIFVWKISPSNNAPAGSAAGCADDRGYVKIRIDGTVYYGHRLAWFYVHGKWPKKLLDHRNLLKSRNVIKNLRQCNHSQNKANRRKQRNNTSGVKGVYWHKRAHRWIAQIMVKKRNTYLGSYKSKRAAALAYRTAAKVSFGEFSR